MRVDDALLIDGKLRASGGGMFAVTNPATEDEVGAVADATAADLDEAIGSARRAFDETAWATDRDLRRRCLLQLHEALVGEQEELRAILIAEAGCPLLATYGPQLDAVLEDALLWPAEQMTSFPWERDLGRSEKFFQSNRRYVWKEPVGVVAAITPWNFPFEVTITKVAQALATGNTVVLKPAPDTPINALLLGRLVAEATDIPAGIVNVVTGADHGLGRALAADPRVDLVSFTGSTAVGREIVTSSGATLTRLFLELGGKSAHIVLDDADLPTVIPSVAMGVTFHAGQGCGILTRLLVHESRYEESVELATHAMRQVAYGDPTSPENLMGPVISDRQRTRVLGLIGEGTRAGGEVLVGGGRPAHLERGFYVEPTLFGAVEASNPVAREEIFGPVLVMQTYRNDNHAVQLANDSAYGLSGGISSASEERALGVARRIRTGTLSINGGVFYGADVPFGGRGASGYGRQNGVEGFEQYLMSKAIGLPA